jgi:hypothetical protein
VGCRLQALVGGESERTIRFITKAAGTVLKGSIQQSPFRPFSIGPLLGFQFSAR